MSDPYNDPLIKARDRAIERIVVQLNTVRSLAETGSSQVPPRLVAELLAHLDRALFWLGEVHAGNLPEQTRSRRLSLSSHLEAASALAEEHLSAEDPEGKARLAIKRALSTLRGGSQSS